MSPKATPKLSYEAAFAKLEQIAEQLESGTLTLDESLALYQESTQLAAFLEKALQQAEQKITQLQTTTTEEDPNA